MPKKAKAKKQTQEAAFEYLAGALSSLQHEVKSISSVLVGILGKMGAPTLPPRPVLPLDFLHFDAPTAAQSLWSTVRVSERYQVCQAFAQPVGAYGQGFKTPATLAQTNMRAPDGTLPVGPVTLSWVMFGLEEDVAIFCEQAFLTVRADGGVERVFPLGAPNGTVGQLVLPKRALIHVHNDGPMEPDVRVRITLTPHGELP